MNRFLPLTCLFLSMLISWVSHAEEAINCSAKHSLFHGSTNVVAFYHFILKENNGMVLINGKLSHDGTESTISRNIYFKYKSIPPDNYLAESSNITKIPADNTPDEIMEQHFPLFFTRTEIPLHLNIKKIASTSYLISFFKTPLFYCTKN